MTTDLRTRSDCGFTLLEVLVAVFILALIGIMAYRGLDSVRSTSDRVNGLADRWQAITQLLGRFERDVRMSFNQPGKSRQGILLSGWRGGNETDPAEAVERTQVSFLRLGGDQGGPFRVGYRVRDGKLELLLWGAGDDLGLREPKGVYTMLDGVSSMELAFMNDYATYVDHWPEQDLSAMPRAIRLTLNLQEGSLDRIIDLR